MHDVRKLPDIAAQLVLSVLAVFYLAHAAANECLNLLPDDAAEDGLPKICQSGITGMKSNYGCQDYRSGETRYRVLYKGGRSAKAVLILNPDGSELVLSSPLHGDQKLNCPLKAPTGVPKYATHRGVGVCRDENDKPLACSIFQHAAARQALAHLYMVYYPNDKQHKIQVEVENAGVNENAMVAEIAYQIGQSLLKTTCCSDRAMHYLAYAYRLFPRSETYRQAYQHSRALMAFANL